MHCVCVCLEKSKETFPDLNMQIILKQIKLFVICVIETQVRTSIEALKITPHLNHRPYLMMISEDTVLL